MSVTQILNEFSVLKQVDTIALGGSRSTCDADDKSDYDIYIFILKATLMKQFAK